MGSNISPEILHTVPMHHVCSGPVTKDQASQASFPCRTCVALETSMTSLDDDDSLQGEEPSLQDEGQNQQPLF